MNPRELLQSGAQVLGFPLSIEQINSLFIYLTELKKWNEKINLTAIRDERDSIVKNVLDSLSYLKGFTPAPELKLLDMGSGAGFPALPIKIAYPGNTVAMVESVKKKASFLRHIVRTLKITGVEVLDKRIQELPESFNESMDVVTARAFTNMNGAIIAGLPFLKANGRIVLSRGPEETISDQDLARAGLVVHTKIELTLPHSDYKRAIWVFRKPG